MVSQGRGRQRVRPRAARRAAERAAQKVGGRAERRGRSVPPTVAGFEAALHDRGHDGVAEALISRHNQRMERIADVGHTMQCIGLPLLASYLPLALAAEELGAHPGRAPIHSGPTWEDHLAWGLDSVAAAVRLMMSLQPVGASIIARTQLERWSSNLEFSSLIRQEPGETTVAWLNRLWSAPVVWPDGVATPVGDLFADVSELLHGRGRLMPLVWLDIADVTDAPSSEHVRLLDTISDSLVVSLSHIRTCLATVAEARGRGYRAQTINMVRLVSPARSWVPDLRAFLFPLVPDHFRGVEGPLGATATEHRRVVSALRAGQRPDAPSELWPVLSFGAQRFRALILAEHAHRTEREALGDRFDEQGIQNHATEAVLAGEMAAVLAVWLRQDPAKRSAADAFAVCASGLRSAQWLWLEDDDRGMGCLRCVIEQVARARTWRVRPDRAARIEANPKSTPRDWVEGAGWKRLNLLNRALGEFAHGSTRTNWNAARGALVALQANAEADEEAQYTGRTHALAAMIFIVSVECAAWVDSFSSQLGEAYRKVIRVDDAGADRAIDALMNRAWEKRGTPLR
ncbi:hypothetical protein [Micromonospora sp. NPDC005173]|uniref:hypothetical protein n=1 Tax=Micromonospora sp. NPDC005173 TaxID=3157165 RepID=UPI0033B7CE0B